MEKKVKEKKPKEEPKDTLDFSDIDKTSQDSFPNDLLNLPTEPLITVPPAAFVPTMCDIDVNIPINITEAVATEVPAIPVENDEMNTPPIASTPTEKPETEISACIVCDKKFKTKSCMNKHLRSVHTGTNQIIFLKLYIIFLLSNSLFGRLVRVLTGVKRSSSQSSSSKSHSSSTKRSHLNDSQSSITHTGSPVNPMTAKALASKLNERNNLLHAALHAAKKSCQTSVKPLTSANSTKNTLNDIPVPPLISIQTTQRFVDMENIQQRINTVPSGIQSPIKNGSNADLETDVPTFNIFKKSTHENGSTNQVYQASHSATSADDMNMVKN